MPLQAAPFAAPVSAFAPGGLPSVEPIPVAESAIAPPTPAENEYPIDLAGAIHLAGGESLAVALARHQWREAAARARAAEAMWLPSVRAGLNYNKHEGVIQDVVGNAFNTSRGALYNGFGAGAVGAGSPTYPGLLANFHLADALTEPQAARWTASSRSRATNAAMNDALLDAGLAYVELLSAAQETAVAADVLEYARRLTDLTGEFAKTGAGTLADADRARAEANLRTVEAARAQEAYDVARARLAQLLRIDPTLRIVPLDDRVEPLEFIDPELPAAELVARGLSARPELAEQRDLVNAAVTRLRRERLAVLMPSVLVGTSYGAFGAGTGGKIDGYGDRFDFDAVAYWELRNLGAGNRAASDTAAARVDQERTRQMAVMDRVAREVVEADARVRARRNRMAAARDATLAAEDSLRRNDERIHNGVGLPIETLQALGALSSARREYVRAVSDYNAAQLSLQRAMGYPVDGQVEQAP
jgi:outer membrane protein TolC